MRSYVPNKGDYIAVTFDPQSGREQKGRRPALVVSNSLFNKHTGLAIVCPITNTRRNFPFHVAVADDKALTGFIMVEQVKSIDFRADKLAGSLAPPTRSWTKCCRCWTPASTESLLPPRLSLRTRL